jgi:hypothetical protein
LLPAAIEEVLRFRSPFPRLARRTATEVSIEGHAITADQIIILWVASANRDGAQFPNPDRFDIHRTPNAHLAFGHGIHFCLGAPLAGRARSRSHPARQCRRSPSLARAMLFYNPWTIVSAKRLPVHVGTHDG